MISIRTLGLSAVLTTLSSLGNRYRTNADYFVGTDVNYAVYVEFGTYKMSAQPFLRPAANEVGENLSQIAKDQGSGDAILKAVALEVEGKAKRRCPVDTGNLRGSIRTWQG